MKTIKEMVDNIGDPILKAGKVLEEIKRNEKGQFVRGFKHSDGWKKYISRKMKGREITRNYSLS